MHLRKLQETVLREIEVSNAKTKEMLDFALLAVGFIGSLVIAIFAYFGWTTALEIKDQKAKAAELIKSLGERQAQADEALVKFKAAQADIASGILKSIAPKLGQIANYGMKIAEFVGRPIGSTVSRAYFLARIKETEEKKRDTDLDSIREATKFKELVAAS